VVAVRAGTHGAPRLAVDWQEPVGEPASTVHVQSTRDPPFPSGISAPIPGRRQGQLPPRASFPVSLARGDRTTARQAAASQRLARAVLSALIVAFLLPLGEASRMRAGVLVLDLHGLPRQLRLTSSITPACCRPLAKEDHVRLAIAVFCMLLCSAVIQARMPAGPSQDTPAASKAAVATPINLNTATAEQLQKLPGVGPKVAARIVEYRQKNGPFKKTEELMNVRGIGEKSFLKLKDQITVTSTKAVVS
jgi:comEA protein